MSSVKSPTELLDAAGAAIRQAALGDLRLRVRSARASGPLPSLRFARRIRLELRQTRTAKLGWRFIFPIGNHDWDVAEVKIDVALEPSARGGGADLTPGTASFVAPVFLTSAGGSATVAVRLLDGRIMELEVRNGTARGRIPPDKFERVNSSSFPEHWYAAILTLLFDWARVGTNGSPVPLDALNPPIEPPAAFVFDTVLAIRTQFARWKRFVEAPQDAPATEEKEEWQAGTALLSAIHPDLASGYRLGRCTANIRVWVDPDGKIAEAKSNPSQCAKLDFTGSIVVSPGTHEVRITANPIDMVTEGPRHSELLRAVRDGSEKIFQSIDSSEIGPHDAPALPHVSKLTVDMFVCDPLNDTRAVFARIRRDVKDGLDSYLGYFEGVLSGVPGWMIFEIRFSVDSLGKPALGLTAFQFCKFARQVYYSTTELDDVRDYSSAVVHTLVSWHNLLRGRGGP